MDFDQTVILFDEYYRHEDSVDPAFNKDLACEGRKRLTQTNKLLRMIIELEGEDRTLSPPPGNWVKGENPEVDKTIYRMTEIGDELEFLTEAFYLFAFRLREIIKLLPELKNFECEGVRDVRNHLLVHPERKDSEVFIQSFGHGGSQGPVIKALRYSDQVNISPDKGLFVNAAELKKTSKNGCLRT